MKEMNKRNWGFEKLIVSFRPLRSETCERLRVAVLAYIPPLFVLQSTRNHFSHCNPREEDQKEGSSRWRIRFHVLDFISYCYVQLTGVSNLTLNNITHRNYVHYAINANSLRDFTINVIQDLNAD